jgi:hypothetical protein
MLRNTSVFLALSLAAGLASGLALAANGPSGPVPTNAPVGSLENNGGRILCTAAINSNGSIATEVEDSFIDPATTLKAPDGVKVGTYQVGFKGPCANVQIANGWFRLVPPDTLTFGTLPARSCTVADRFNVHNAVWIQCFDHNGNLVDTSFTLSVSR